MSRQRVEVHVLLKSETPKAWCVQDENDDEHWVPKKLCGLVREEGTMETYVLSIPEWLAKEKGLI